MVFGVLNQYICSEHINSVLISNLKEMTKELHGELSLEHMYNYTSCSLLREKETTAIRLESSAPERRQPILLTPIILLLRLTNSRSQQMSDVLRYTAAYKNKS